jgi:hypothetical protein
MPVQPLDSKTHDQKAWQYCELTLWHSPQQGE